MLHHALAVGDGVAALGQNLVAHHLANRFRNALVDVGGATTQRLGFEFEVGCHQLHGLLAADRAQVNHAPDHQIA